ncbi:hypothetical protein N8955_00350 [bacterium]|jgi:hypothetical protein|nr:hypothetical protein [bacterium]MDA9225089.1 hypothetical protein [bacterium]
MASGSTLSVSGGYTMTQVVAGDTIDDADYDGMKNNVYRQLSTPADYTLGTYTASSIYGYNQSIGSLDAAAGELVRASSTDNGYKNLQDEIQAVGTFLGLSLNSTSTSDEVAGGSITATDWSNLMSDVKSCFDGRFSVPGGSLTSEALISNSRTSGWGSSGTPEVTHEFSVNFSNEAHARAFFNAGGEVNFTAARSGGTSGSSAGTIGSQNANWTALLSAMGTLTFNLNNVVSSGSTGTSAGKGFYELTTSYQQVYIKYGSSSYASNYYQLVAKVNSTTNPTAITFKATFRDDHALGDGIGADGVDGNADDTVGYVDSVDGTVSSTATTKRANNGIALAQPSSTAISNL